MSSKGNVGDSSNCEAILAEEVIGYIQVFHLYQIIGSNLAQQCGFLSNQVLIHAQTAKDILNFPKGIRVERRQGKPCADTTSLVRAANAGQLDSAGCSFVQRDLDSHQ
jgi:hypothetical protein